MQHFSRNSEAYNLSDRMNLQHSPTVAIVLYEMIDKGNTANNSSKSYLEAYDVVKGELRNARPVRLKAIKNFLNQVGTIQSKEKSDRVEFKRAIPKNVVTLQHQHEDFLLMWTIPAHIRKITFAAGLKLQTGLYPIPELLFACNGDEDDGLSIWAISKSTLYGSPLPNSYPDGGICWGNVKLPKTQPKDAESLMEWWEGMFFNSLFTDHNASVKGFGSYLNKKTYPVSKLIESDTQLEDLYL